MQQDSKTQEPIITIESKPAQRNPFAIFLRGLAMGSIDIVPGISGGTIAFITGIYPRLIRAIDQVSTAVTDTIKNPKQIKQSIINLDWKFLIPLATGIAIAIFLMSGLMTYLIESFPANTFAFFAGLIIASAYLMNKSLEKINSKNVVALIIGIFFAYVISGLSATTLIQSTLPIIFVSGMVAICAMLLPGISGAFLLVLLGQYQTVVTAIHNKTLTIIVTFGLGALLGLAIFSKIVNFLLEKHKQLTLYSLTGIMLGALRVPYLEITNNGGFQNPIYLIYFLILGAGIVYGTNLIAFLFSQK
jgi:putative membrane protein